MLALRLAAILCASVAMIPAAMAQTQNQQTAQDECIRLEAMIVENQRTGRDTVIDIDQVRTWRQEQNRQACRDALRKMQTAAGQQQQIGQQQQGEGAQIFVEQPPAEVQIQQGQPEILVHQPAPRVTVHIPQPEITVRMPQPQAQVSQAAPQVSVRQPQPTVQVEEAQQQADVQVEQGQPQVRYEAEEPQVEVQRAEGQPTVRVERMAQEGGEWQQGQEQAQAQQTQQRPRQQAQQTPQRPQQQALREEPAQQADQTEQRQGQTQPVRVSELEGMDVVNAQGTQIGDVEQVLVDTRNDKFVVIGHGGFLGLGEKQIALPVNKLWLSNDRLMIQELTDEQIAAMPAWEGNVEGVRQLEDDQTVEVAETQQ